MKIVEKKMTNREYIKQNNISITEEYEAFFFSDITKRKRNSLCTEDKPLDAMCYERIYYEEWLNETYDGWTLNSIKKKKQAWLSKEETNGE